MESFDQLGARFQGMEQLWREEIEPALEAQRARRERNLWLLAALAVLCGGLMSGAYFWAPSEQSLLPEPIMGGIVLFGIGLGLLRANLKKGEEAWISAAFDRMGLSYSKESGDFPLLRFASVGVIPRYDRSELEDRITGDHEGVSFDLVEADLQEKRKRKTKNGTRTTYVTVFDGLLIRCGFTREFSGFTLVKRDGGFLGNLFGGGGKGERVRLEDPEFERVFEVFSNDQVEARYLLTPGFMQRLLDLDSHLGSGKLALAFSGQEVWIALRQKGDSFRMGGLFKGYSRESIADFFKGVADLFFLIEELNRRGGTKP